MNQRSLAPRTRTSLFTARFRTLLGALSFAALAAAAVPAHAVGTRTFVLSSLDDLKGGDLKGVSIDSGGAVRAGLTLGSVPLPDATSVWSSVTLADGSVLLGTGTEGKVFKVSGGAVTLIATTGQMAVSALALAWNGDVIAGTFPDGKLYKIQPNGTGAQAAELTTLEDAEDIWDLAYDAKNKALYAATGPEGRLFRIDAAGKAQVYFDSEEPHLVSLALADDGALYAGSNGKGLLYKLTGPGRASVVYDFGTDDVKAIAIAPASKGGAVYAIANKYPEPTLPSKKSGSSSASSKSTKASKPGKGVLMRFGQDGVAEEMLEDDKTHFVSLALGEDGLPYVGTGSDGMVYAVDDDHVVRLVADTDERQVGAIAMAGKRRFIATTDPAVFHEIKGVGGADAVWTSKVLDAGLRAGFGRLDWRSEGALALSTRSGNTAVPDATWSAWSTDVAAPTEITSPAARYVQVRSRWSRDPAAVLREVTLSFVTDNARALVTSIDALPKGQSRASLKAGIAASGGDAPKPSTTIHISWKIENPDQDDLRYRVTYRKDGEATFHDLLKPGETLTKTDYDWDTSLLPEGTYRLRVEASDELANAPGKEKRHALESTTVLVDNTPPVLASLAMNGRRLTGEARDGLGPIARIEVAVVGVDEWRPIFPSDGVFDESAEAFDADLSTIVAAGRQILAVRVYDSAGNAVTRNVEAR